MASICQDLALEIEAFRKSIQDLQTQMAEQQKKLEEEWDIANALGVGLRDAILAQIEKTKEKIEAIEKKLNAANDRLTALMNQSSKLTCVEKKFECSGPTDEILGLPIFEAGGPPITYNTTDLENEKARLTAEREKLLDPIEKLFVSLPGKINTLITGPPTLEQRLSTQKLFMDGSGMGLIFNTIAAELGLTVAEVPEPPEAIKKAAERMTRLLTTHTNWRGPYKNKTPPANSVLRDVARQELDTIIQGLINDLQKERREILVKYSTDCLTAEIEKFKNPNSEHNKNASNTIIDILKEARNKAPKPNISSTITVSAPGGPGLFTPPGVNPCEQTVSKTETNHLSVSYSANDHIIALNPAAAVQLLGPGGCDDGIWLHPVNIVVNNISVNNLEDIKNFLTKTLVENPKYISLREQKSRCIGGMKITINDASFDNIVTTFDLIGKKLQACVSK